MFKWQITCDSGEDGSTSPPQCAFLTANTFLTTTTGGVDSLFPEGKQPKISLIAMGEMGGMYGEWSFEGVLEEVRLALRDSTRKQSAS